MNLESTLLEKFGFSEFREGQKQVIENLLNGHSSLAIFPTGGGKSICYQLPALLLDGITLVISPLIALMKDQVQSLENKGIPAVRIDSSIASEDWIENKRRIASGEIKLLFISPERFSNEGFREWIKTLSISLIAIDEAHCLSEWGHNFRPDYLKLGKIAKQLKIPRVLCLTATATKSVEKDIRSVFKIKAEHSVKTTFKRPHLSLRIHPVNASERDQQLLEFIQSHPNDATIVYVTLQSTAEAVATFLKNQGIAARPFHAGLSVELKEEIQSDFMANKQQVIVATIAFGMGVDKSDIRYVYHYNVPKTLENYVQETGRAGRDREPSFCVALACADDLVTLESFILGNAPSNEAIRQLIEVLTASSTEVIVDSYHLSTSLDISPIVIDTVLVYLELRGILISQGHYYSEYKVKLVRPMDKILSGHQPARVTFLTKLFDQAKCYRDIYFTFDVFEILEKLSISYKKLSQSLEWLEAHGDITLKPARFRKRYKIKKDKTQYDHAATISEIQANFDQRTVRDTERLAQVVELMETSR